MAEPLRPPIPYFGGKQSIADRIIALLPAHLHYVEPYAGSLSVLLAKPPARMETVNDLDRSLMTFWRMLRDRPEDLTRACALTPHSRAEYSLCETVDVDDDLETARRVWVRLTQGRGGTLRPASTGWRYFIGPRGSSVGMTGNLDAYVGRMAAVAERLHAVSLECRPALEVVFKYGRDEASLLLVDPPYLGSTRGSGNNYRHEMKTDDEHRELAEALHVARAAVMVCGYGSPLYDDELYPHWCRVEIPALTGNGVDQARTEVLWSNRPLGAQLDLFASTGGVLTPYNRQISTTVQKGHTL